MLILLIMELFIIYNVYIMVKPGVESTIFLR